MAGGRPLDYDKNKHYEMIMDAIPRVFTINGTAYYCGIAPTTFKGWLKSGAEDKNAGSSTDLAQLATDVKKAQFKCVEEKLNMLRDAPKNWQAQAWILERCFREEFGQDSSQIRELIDLVNQLSKKLMEQQK